MIYSISLQGLGAKYLVLSAANEKKTIDQIVVNKCSVLDPRYRTYSLSDQISTKIELESPDEYKGS